MRPERAGRKSGLGRLAALMHLPPAMLLPTAALSTLSYLYLSPYLRPGQQVGWGVVAFILARNLVLYLGVYGLLTLLFYRGGRVRQRAEPLKFNARGPGREETWRDARRTLGSGLVGSGYDVLVALAVSRGQLTFSTGSLASLVLGGVFVFFWMDLHFYCTHRLLHTPWLMRHVHSLHHQSFNPQPWSGLAFHPVEAALYFSALLVAWVVPLHAGAFVFMKVALDTVPAFGHLGYGGWTGGSRFHYIHHAQGRSNYGATALWDSLLGTLQRRPRPDVRPV